MTDHIERLEQILAYENRWLKAYFDLVRFPDGRVDNYNRVVEGEGHEGVAILPMDGTAVGLVRQYRYPIGQHSWEIPRGFADGPHSRIEAVRELREETGYQVLPENLIDLGTIHPNGGLLASKIHLYAADCSRIVRTQHTDDGEILEFHWFEADRLESRIENFDIQDACTLSAICRAALLGYRPLR